MEKTLKIQLKTYQDRVHQVLKNYLQQPKFNQKNLSPKLIEAIRYATLNNGKRLRPALIYATGQVLNIPLKNLDSAACSIELIHSYSLVHDDLPAMDDDNLRRGQPTCHIKYDESTAILVGDAQQALAFQILSEDPYITDRAKVTLIQLLSQASGIEGIVSGQMIDIQSAGLLTNLTILKNMHLLKTGALIRVALQMGACQSEHYSNLNQPLCRYGNTIGLAFQVQDDILNITNDTKILGKTQGSDQAAGKSTYPKILGLAESEAYRDKLIADALNQLKQMQESTGFRSDFLKKLTNYIAQRSY